MKCARLAENEVARRRQVEEFVSSGMTMKQWCANNGIKQSTLSYWRRKFNNEGTCQGTWVEIGELQNSDLSAAASASVPTTTDSVSIRVGAFIIEATRTSDAEALRTALIAAASLC
jgi:transposase-like protein